MREIQHLTYIRGGQHLRQAWRDNNLHHTYVNTGAGPANNITIENAIPTTVTYVSGSGETYDSAGRRVYWTFPGIPAGGSGTLR